MTTTKSEILALLKRNGGQSVADLAAVLHLASITIRQHLTHLQRDGLIVSERRSGSNGRAHYAYRLSAKGHAAGFPRRSDRIVALLMREIGFLDGQEISGLSPKEKTRLVLERLARRLAEEYAPLVQGWPLRERVVFVTEVMHADGGFAEWEETAGGYEIRDFNCLFHQLLDGDEDACLWHRRFLTLMLGAEVRVRPCVDGAARCCHYEIKRIDKAAPVRGHPVVSRT